MREMKDSGVSWIGEIPEEWNLIPAKRVFHSDKRIVGNAVNEYERLALTMSGVIKRSKEDNEGLQPDKFEGYQILQENELVFKLIDLENVKTSRVGLSPYTGLVSPAYIVLSNDSDDNRFYFYWYLSLYYNEVFNRLGGNGVRSALNAKDILSLPIPDIYESIKKRIADYLDTKCAKIDAIITRQQQVIEKLKAYKLSVITEAVTRGLNPDVPMKDSGIEWIGTVPSAWRIGQLKYFATVRSGITLGKKYPPKAELIEVPYLRVANVQGEYIDLTDVAHILVLPVEAEKYQLHKGELLMTEGGDRDKLGRGCVWHGEIEPCLHQNHVYAVTTDPQHLSVHFLDYMTTSAVARNYFDYTAKKTTNLASTNATTILQFRFPIPPAEEQLAIVEYLNQICQRTDHVIAQHSAIIDKLTEYKKSLIYEVVTGKREIDADLPQATTVAVISPELLKYMKAVLMVRLIDGLGDHVLGRVQVQKGLYFAETSSNPRLHLETNYARYTHGPFDREIWDYEAIMAENGWIYSTTDEQERTIYRRGEHFSEYRDEYQRLFPGCEKTVQRIIDFVKQFQYTDGVEKVATLFAAWNDFIIDGVISPTDEEIIAEVRNHWTENKGRIKERTWRRSLARLKDAQFIPQGYGKHTVKWQGGQVHG